MKLRDYLYKKRIRQIDFAKEVGISQTQLNKWINGSRIPSRKNAMKIEELTEGKVTAHEMLFPEKYPEEEI